MASGEGNFDAELLLHQYLYDYMKKKKMFRSAEIFKQETKLKDHPVGINDSGKGVLDEWWCFFGDVFVKTHYKSNYMDTPADSLQIMQSPISTQPQIGTQGQTLGSSSGAPGDFPRAFFPGQESRLRLEVADYSEDEVKIIGPGEFTQPRRPSHDCEERGWPDKGSDRSSEPQFSPQAEPATCGGEAPSSRNPAGDNSNLNCINDGSNVTHK